MNRITPVLLVLSCAAGPVAALPTEDAGWPEFSMLDTDGDALISRTEAKASDTVIVGFDRIDTNRDGTLDEQEYQEAKGGQASDQ